MSDNYKVEELFKKYTNNLCTEEEFGELLAILSQSGSQHKYPKIWDDFFSQVELLKDQLEDDSIGDEAFQVLSIAKSQETQRLNSRKNDIRTKYILQIAASIIILFTISAIWLQHNYREINKPVISEGRMLERQTAYGERTEITLSDGSNVVLNSGSSLQFPQQFGETRKLRLKGQAFFNVTKNPQKPFIIETNSVTVAVLGTSFDVKNFDDDDYARVTVSTGKVKVQGRHGECFYLLPDDQLLLNKKTGEFLMSRVDASKFTLWREGTLYFENTSIADMVKQLERNYDVKINLENPSVSQRMVSGEHANENIWSVLKTLNFTHQLDFRIENNQIHLFKMEKNE